MNRQHVVLKDPSVELDQLLCHLPQSYIFSRLICLSPHDFPTGMARRRDQRTALGFSLLLTFVFWFLFDPFQCGTHAVGFIQVASSAIPIIQRFYIPIKQRKVSGRFHSPG
jgi:hypothetical protein